MDSAGLSEQMGGFQELCREAGLRITPQRMAVYRVLVRSKEHPSAESVYRQVKEEFANISLDTVNRTLLTLAEIGAAFIVEGSGEPRRFDARVEDHQHFRCIKCRKVMDFCGEGAEDVRVPQEIAERCVVLRKSVYLEGLCEECKWSVQRSQDGNGARRERT